MLEIVLTLCLLGTADCREAVSHQKFADEIACGAQLIVDKAAFEKAVDGRATVTAAECRPVEAQETPAEKSPEAPKQ